jgi:hypothetical protein
MLIKVPTVERKLVDGKPVKEFKDLVLEVADEILNKINDVLKEVGSTVSKN